ncbi:MAG: DNA primase [Massiliimalia sp.]|jgi:DNA primase
MSIPQSFIQQLLNQCDIEDIISSYVVLKREGKNRKGLCPFHSEKTPSMVVYGDTQSFYCFGCGAGGDVISFIRKIENLDYVEAIQFLARRVGLEVPSDGEGDRTGQMKARILEINRAAAHYYHDCLKSPIGRPGLAYLKSRQMENKTIVKYGLGFAPPGWDSLIRHLKEKGFRLEEMEAAKVAVKGRNGSYYDFFRNRVMFPVIDLRGNVIAFGGRVLDDSKPKYLNTSDTLVFKKSRNLFSMNFAKNVKSQQLILAEGYMDVISINAAGFENVVATLGTALTPEQARLMSKYAKEVIIAYDSDGAGQTATHRAINLLSEVGLAAKTLKIEGAKDPDEFIKKFGARRFEILLENAGNVVEFELSKAKSACDLNDTNGKLEYIRRAVSILSSVENPLEREIYAGIVAKELSVQAENILTQVNSAIRRKQRKKEREEWNDIQTNKAVLQDRINPQKSQMLREALAEEGILAFVFRHPEELSYVLSKISEQDFPTDFNRRVFSAIADKIKESQEIQLGMIAPLFTPEENADISKILAKNSEKALTKPVVDDYIDVLLAHKNSLKAKDIQELSLDEIENFRQRKGRQKAHPSIE